LQQRQTHALMFQSRGFFIALLISCLLPQAKALRQTPVSRPRFRASAVPAPPGSVSQSVDAGVTSTISSSLI
jgi:hypothetical protein